MSGICGEKQVHHWFMLYFLLTTKEAWTKNCFSQESAILFDVVLVWLGAGEALQRPDGIGSDVVRACLMYVRVAYTVGIITKKKAFDLKYLHWSIHLPTHSSDHFSSHSGKKLRRVFRTSISPALSEGPQGTPRPVVICNPSQESRTYTGASPRWTCLEHLQGEVSWRHPDHTPKPPQLVPADAKKQQLCSELPPDVRALHSGSISTSRLSCWPPLSQQMSWG